VSKRTFGAALAALALTLGADAAAAQQKVGFVQVAVVVASAPDMAAVRQTMEREFAGTRASMDSMETRLTTGQQQLQQQASTLSEQVRQQRSQELQQLYQQYQQRGQQAQAQAQQRESQLMEPVLRRVSDAIEAERAAGAYAYILDAGANFVIAVDPALDITNRVITRLGGTPPAAGAAAPRQ
jgi:outer membrane protein